MQNYTNRNLGVNIFSKKGIVLSSQVKSETHVSSHGGGGYLYEGSGTIRAPQITSSIHREQEIWIKTPKGVDECIRLKECDLQVMQGQRVTFVLAGQMGEDQGYYAMLINHDAAKWWWIASANDLVGWLKLIPSPPLRNEGMGCVGCGTFLLSTIILGTAYFVYQDASKYHSVKPDDAKLLTAMVVLGGLFLLWSFLAHARRGRIRAENERASAENTTWRNQFADGHKNHLEKIGRETGY